MVFFSVSLDHVHLQVIYVIKSSSSSSHLDLDHLSIWITKKMASLDLDHHSIWINITGLDLDHHSIWIISLDWIWIITRSGSSLLDMDHHSIWIITAGSGSSLDLDLSESSYLDLDHLSIWISAGHHQVCTISS